MIGILARSSKTVPSRLLPLSVPVLKRETVIPFGETSVDSRSAFWVCEMTSQMSRSAISYDDYGELPVRKDGTKAVRQRY